MLASALQNILRAFPHDRRGNVAIFAALAMPVLIGSLGLGAEVASWYGGKRAMQNAADSAAIAAATNGTDNNYDDEARAVAWQYGFQDGVDGVAIVASDTAPCPGGGGNECYSVTISKPQPLLLAQIIGFQGDTAIDGSPAKLIRARAVAIQSNVPREYCILALASSGDPEALRTNGAPKADMTGCSVMSNTNSRCNGHDLGADFGDAHGTNDGCGRRSNSNLPVVTDPYSGLAENIPADPCSSYPEAPKKKNDPELPSDNMLAGLINDETITVCGDAQLSTPVFINSGKNTTLVIYNGGLDMNDFKLQTMPGSSLTIIFAGSDDKRMHAPFGNGTFDFNAPTTGPWKGVALYQKPSLKGGVDIEEAGNSPTWNITGLAYFPKASVTLSGAISKSSNGKACVALVVDNLTINGTGSILDHGECHKAGLTLPFSEMPSRGELVS